MFFKTKRHRRECKLRKWKADNWPNLDAFLRSELDHDLEVALTGWQIGSRLSPKQRADGISPVPLINH